MYNHNKAQQSKNRVHISWDILYLPLLGLKSIQDCSSGTIWLQLRTRLWMYLDQSTISPSIKRLELYLSLHIHASAGFIQPWYITAGKNYWNGCSCMVAVKFIMPAWYLALASIANTLIYVVHMSSQFWIEFCNECLCSFNLKNWKFYTYICNLPCFNVISLSSNTFDTMYFAVPYTIDIVSSVSNAKVDFYLIFMRFQLHNDIMLMLISTKPLGIMDSSP